MKLVAITAYYKPAYVYGGPVKSEANLYEGLAKLGVDVTVITTNANGQNQLDVPLLTPVNINGVRVLYCSVESRIGSPFYSSTQVTQAKHQIPEADIVHLQTFWSYATQPLSQYCLSHKIPYFVSLRGQLMDYSMKQMPLIKRIKKQLFLNLFGYQYLNGAAALHCTAPVEAHQLTQYPITSQTFVLPNGIELSNYAVLPPRGTFRSKYNIPTDAFVLLMLGRIHEVKNPQIGVSVLAALKNHSREVHLFMVGPDEQGLQAVLVEHAKKLGCDDRLHFPGLLQTTEILQVLSDTDLFIMPSRFENFGMSAAEVMAAGIPILVSSAVPVGKIAEEMHAGKTAPPESAAFCNAALEMLRDSSLLERMGKNALVAAKCFDHQTIAENMLMHLTRIVQGK